MLIFSSIELNFQQLALYLTLVKPRVLKPNEHYYRMVYAKKLTPNFCGIVHVKIEFIALGSTTVHSNSLIKHNCTYRTPPTTHPSALFKKYIKTNSKFTKFKSTALVWVEQGWPHLLKLEKHKERTIFIRESTTVPLTLLCCE